MNIDKLIKKDDYFCVNCKEKIKQNDYVYSYNKHHIFMCLKCWKGLLKNG